MLEVRDLHAWYGGSHVLRGVQFKVQPGEIVALLGRNGSGRSTVAKALMGLVEWSGSIQWQDRSTSGLRPYQIARLALGYVPEHRDVFPALTVQENLRLGRKPGRVRGTWTFDDVYRMFPALGERRSLRAGLLSGGEQQMLSLSRTLMGDPALIVVDEPCEGLAPQLVVQVAVFLGALRRKGVAVLLIEQKLVFGLSLSDRALVLGDGRMVFDGPPRALLEDEQVRREWLEV
jgi:branched-chain amino acid transport system ATP-binding protein